MDGEAKPKDPLLLQVVAADRGDPPPPAPGDHAAPPDAPVVTVDPSAAAIDFVQTWAPLVRACLPDACAKAFDAEREVRIGRALALVAQKRGWTFLDKAGPEAKLAAECFPVAAPVVLPWIKDQLVKAKPAPAVEEPKRDAPGTGAPGSDTAPPAPADSMLTK